MARTTQEILTVMVDKKNSYPELVTMNSSSKTAIWRLIFYIVAFAHNLLEQIFDLHKIEINSIIASDKVHTPGWYKTKALEFQYGYTLPDGSDVYDNSGVSETLIEQSKIIAFAAVTPKRSGIKVKVAKSISEELAQLSETELEAFTTFMRKVADAGIEVECVSLAAELLKLQLTIYYDALVLTSDGQRIDGTNATPVYDAIKKYIENTEFDGTIMLHKIIDSLQSVEGIIIPEIDHAFYKYGDLDYIEFESYHRPDSGYMKLDTIEVNYIPNTNIT
ncbi:MAG: hypothetical protein RBS07_15740 [Lentimicrobium sp.]|jgi:hypothetical protein|nr:hypothetical protein [Lentimicrobium sp.]